MSVTASSPSSRCIYTSTNNSSSTSCCAILSTRTVTATTYCNCKLLTYCTY